MTRLMILLAAVLLSCSHAVAQGGSTAVRHSESTTSIHELPDFEKAVILIKHFEGFHTKKDRPYYGWGHRKQPGEHLSENMTRQEADALLRSDLTKLCRLFSGFGKDSLLLSCLAYNVGAYRLIGTKNRPTSRLIQMLRQGQRDIEAEYMTYCRWKGKVIPSIRRRRWAELQLLYHR